MLYLTESIINGLRILGFDKNTIKKVAREKSLEEIFISNLFLNYLIVLIIFTTSLFIGGFKIDGRELNQVIFFALLMIYPFTFNLFVYFIYALFGYMAESLDKKCHTKKLINVGFHTAIVYAFIFYIIILISYFSLKFASFLILAFMIYFMYVMFISISVLYNFSLHKVLIVILVPFLIISLLLLFLQLFFPTFLKDLFFKLFV
jgi:hypothetical protein